MSTFDDELHALDERFRKAQADGHVPGVAWGVVRGGELVHAGGAGTIREGEDVTPDADSVYLIASMTKSFTAASILLLRDEGRLRLDDEAATWVPALAGWRGPTTDSPPVTIRHLLTMSSGLPTDDPWGDRQQAMPFATLDSFLAAGPSFAWPTGTEFEYSNLGYAILGRVVTAAAGVEYRTFVEQRLFAPLGMTSTAFREEDVPADRLAHGYARVGDTLIREGTDAYGAFASMGGVYSTVRDLARWVTGFLEAFPARDDPEGGHPLRRASRREMQQIHRALSAAISEHAAHEAPAAESAGYGFGLFLVSDGVIGMRIGHGGGYPGYGSYMNWHPGTGLGVVSLGNLRYAPVQTPAIDGLGSLVRSGMVARRPARAMPAVARFRELVERLLAHWDDEAADAAFAMNMDLDEPRAGRRAATETLVRELGPFRHMDERPPVSMSPGHLRWFLRGDHGWLRVAILASPEPEPRLQAMRLTGIPDPSPALRETASRLLALDATSATGWPADLVAGPDLDTGLVLRDLRAATARLGVLRLGIPSEGDGATTTTFDVHGEAAAGADAGIAAPASISVTLDAGTGAVTAVAVRITEREAPVEAW